MRGNLHTSSGKLAQFFDFHVIGGSNSIGYYEKGRSKTESVVTDMAIIKRQDNVPLFYLILFLFNAWKLHSSHF
jgi:hypothetical protein